MFIIVPTNTQVSLDCFKPHKDLFEYVNSSISFSSLYILKF